MKTRLTLLASAILVLTATSCKKGEEDPALSLQTRKARISGKWNLSQVNHNWTNHYNGVFQNSGSTIGNESTVTILFNQDNFNVKTTESIVEYTITINRDGTWNSLKNANYETIQKDFDNVTTTTGNLLKTESGVWSFIAKEKGNYKNKERVLVTTFSSDETRGAATSVLVDNNTTLAVTTTSTVPAFSTNYTYANGVNSKTYDLIMLKSKEMKWQHVNDQTTVYSTETYQHESLETIIWKAD